MRIVFLGVSYFISRIKLLRLAVAADGAGSNLTVSNLLHGAILASVNVEPAYALSDSWSHM